MLTEESKIYINSKDIFNQDIKAILTAKPDSWSNMAEERMRGDLLTINKFVRLIEETKPYAMRVLRHANWRERDLQECIRSVLLDTPESWGIEPFMRIF